MAWCRWNITQHPLGSVAQGPADCPGTRRDASHTAACPSIDGIALAGQGQLTRCSDAVRFAAALYLIATASVENSRDMKGASRAMTAPTCHGTVPTDGHCFKWGNSCYMLVVKTARLTPGHFGAQSTSPDYLPSLSHNSPACMLCYVPA